MRIGIHGINGKMGRTIAQTVCQNPKTQLSAAYVRSGHGWQDKPLNVISEIPSTLRSTTRLEMLCQESDVVIDFTRPDATLALLPICQRYNRPVMIGTTGFSEQSRGWLESFARHIPIVLAANTSLGVNVLLEVSARVAKVLGPEDWDVEIFEAHHRRKVDAPSGTALRLGEAIAQAQDTTLNERMRYPYETQRKTGDIGFSVARGGDLPGEHTVYFINDQERLELSHRAYDREIFARGALVAAKWLIGRPAGLYTMADVLGF